MPREITGTLQFAQRVLETGYWATEARSGTERFRIAPIVERVVHPVEDLSIALLGLMRAGKQNNQDATEYYSQKVDTLQQQHPYIGPQLVQTYLDR